MPLDIPKHAIATHPVRKTVDGVSAYTPVFVKLNLDDAQEKRLFDALAQMVDNGSEQELRVFDADSVCYSFNATVKEVRTNDGVAVVLVASGVVHYL
ncbi:MAG: hypothetical protein K2X93_25780 [Candidatus Obscuribacterales bacterium]|nr:hypothetical protein [Candidatus Obscuribacterales bacterium]